MSACLHPGSPAPSFSSIGVSPDGQLVRIDSGQYKGQHLILLFLAGAWSPSAVREVTRFTKAKSRFEDLSCQILMISTDSYFVLQSWQRTNDIRLSLMSDYRKEVSGKYGVLHGSDGVCHNATFILDDKQQIRSVMVNDSRVDRDPAEILMTLQAIQFSDENGEMCPMEWKPGDKKGIKLPLDDIQWHNIL